MSTVQTRSGVLALTMLALVAAGCELVLGLDSPQLYAITSAGGAGGSGGDGASAGEAAGGSGGSVCDPGSIASCYEGPEGTEGVGLCEAGVKVCEQSGAGYGVCQNQVLPAPETCKESTDEDCDHKDCALWSEVFGDDSQQIPLGVGTDAEGNTFVLGAFKGTLALGDPPLVSVDGFDLFLAKLDPSGAVLWSNRYGGAGDQGNGSLAVDPAGNVVIAGPFTGVLGFGGAEIDTMGSTDAYVAKFDSNGARIWNKAYTGGGTQALSSVSTDPEGNVYVAGYFSNSINLGDGAVSSAGANDVVVAKLSKTNGGVVWHHEFGGTKADDATLLVAAPGGAAYVVGRFAGTINFGDGDLVQKVESNLSDLFLVKIDNSGATLWSKSLHCDSTATITTGAVRSTGELVLGGTLSGTLDLAGALVASDGPPQVYDVFLAAFDTEGAHVWSNAFHSNPGNELMGGIVLTPTNDIVVALRGNGTLDFGGDSLASAGGTDIFVAKLNSAGGHVWSRRFGDEADQNRAILASLSDGGVVLGAEISGKVDFGAGTLMTNGQDLALVRLAP